MAGGVHVCRYLAIMTGDDAAFYSAYAARDARFDGVFFVGVTSTGIYCRPVCTAKTPKAANCRFFTSAAAAEKAAYRPCLRCRPELAPGTAPVDDARRIASQVAQRIEQGMLDDGARLETIASKFGWSSRQIRRIVHRELGVSPIELVLTRRLLLAKQLLTETALPITEVAFASGFASLRRFNDAFSARYGMPPSRVRRELRSAQGVMNDGHSFTLQLSYRPPFDWDGLLSFLAARAMEGVEHIENGTYSRSVRLAGRTGWVRLRHAPDRNSLFADVTHSLTPVLPALLGRLRNMFDLAARPDIISAHLGLDPFLAGRVHANPGLRVPGAFDGFELAVRAILGQQISVRAATTLAGRFAEAFGDPFETSRDQLGRLAPMPERVAAARPEELTALGIPQSRATSIISLSRAVSEGRLSLESGADADETIVALVALPGIGAWTAHYIAMRALRWPDAFPKEDLVVRKMLGGVTAVRADVLSQPWRPWRSYATLHLWHAASAT